MSTNNTGSKSNFLQKLISMKMEISAFDQKKRYILTVGEAISQKDILIQFLQGADLEQIIDQNGQTTITTKNIDKTFQQKSIKHFTATENIEIINCPNIQEKDSTFQMLRKVILFRNLIQKCKNMTMVLVIPYEYTIDNSSFLKLLEYLCLMININEQIKPSINLFFTNLESEEDSDDLITLLNNIKDQLHKKNQPIIYSDAFKENRYSMFLKSTEQNRQYLLESLFQKIKFSAFQTKNLKILSKIYQDNNINLKQLSDLQPQISQHIQSSLDIMIRFWLYLCLIKNNQHKTEQAMNYMHILLKKINNFSFGQSALQKQLAQVIGDIKIDDYFCFITNIFLNKRNQLKTQENYHYCIIQIVNFFKGQISKLSEGYSLKKNLQDFIMAIQFVCQLGLSLQSEKQVFQYYSIKQKQIGQIFGELLLEFPELKNSAIYYQYKQSLSFFEQQFIKQKPSNNIKRQYSIKISQQVTEIDWSILSGKRRRLNKASQGNKNSSSQQIRNLLNQIIPESSTQVTIQRSHLLKLFDLLLKFSQVATCLYILLEVDDPFSINSLLKFYLKYSWLEDIRETLDQKIRILSHDIIPYFSHKLSFPKYTQLCLQSLIRCFNFLENVCETQQQYNRYEKILRRYFSKALKIEKKHKIEMQSVYESRQDFRQNPYFQLLIKHQLVQQQAQPQHEMKQVESDIFVMKLKYLLKIDTKQLLKAISDKQNFQRIREVSNITVKITDRYARNGEFLS